MTAESLGGEMISGKTLIFVAGAVAIAWALAVMPEDPDTDASVTAKSELLSRQPASIVPAQNKEKPSSASQMNAPSALGGEDSQADAEMNGSTIDQGSIDLGAAVDESGDTTSNTTSSNYPTDNSNDDSNEEAHLYRPGSSPVEHNSGEYEANEEYGAEEFDEDPMALDQAEGGFGFGEDGARAPETEGLSPDTAKLVPTPTPQEIGPEQTGPQQTWTSGGNLFPPVGTPTPAPEASPSEQSGPGF